MRGKAITGSSLEKTGFKVLRSGKKFEPQKFDKLFSGRAPVYIISDFISGDLCAQVSKRFFNATGATDRKDDVPVMQIGANSFKHDPQTYVDFATETRLRTDFLVSGFSENELDSLLMESTLGVFESRDVSFRLAEYANNKAGRFVARLWQGTGNYALAAHEDLTQQLQPNKHGFEIQKTRQVTSFNACLSNGKGGNLVVWNIEPDKKTKKQLGIENEGFPYPFDLLAATEKTEIRVNAGAVYFVNGNLIHAVSKTISGKRLTFGYFVSRVNRREIIRWT